MGTRCGGGNRSAAALRYTTRYSSVVVVVVVVLDEFGMGVVTLPVVSVVVRLVVVVSSLPQAVSPASAPLRAPQSASAVAARRIVVDDAVMFKLRKLTINLGAAGLSNAARPRSR